jgi:hypothetical protein
MGSNFDGSRPAGPHELDALKSEMEGTRLRFVRATAAFASGWYMQEAGRQVHADPDNSLRLGAGELRRLKAEVSALSENALAVASEVLSDPSAWWHLSGPSGARGYFDYAQYSSHVPKIIDRPVRRVLGRLAEVLERYGYLGEALRPGGEGGVSWREPVHGGAADGSYTFPYDLEWSEEMRAALREYHEAYEAARRIMSEAAEAEAREKRMKVSALWDSL